MHSGGPADTLDSTVRSFSPSRAVVRTGVVFAVLAASSGPSYAQSPGGVALRSARDAWTNADFDLAPGLYQKALDAGGLARADVVEAYARIGAALAIAGKKRAATQAFRAAALVDPTFKVPPEAGTTAMQRHSAAKTRSPRR